MAMKPLEVDLRHIEFLAINSKEIIEKQVDSYRQQHSYAGTIIGFTVLFIPFFLNSLDGTNQILQFISILPIALFIGSILLMLSIFRGKPLDQALSVTKYKQLLTKSYKEILLFEIETNKDSYTKNNVTTLKANKRYLQGIGLITIAIIIAIVMLLVNTFLAIEKKPTKVQVVNSAQKQNNTIHQDTLSNDTKTSNPQK
jgi:Na+/melibiose symporter-like transporter